MKIAVPTDDIITVSDSLINARWIKIFTFQSEYVTGESILKNPRNENGNSTSFQFFTHLGDLLSDCDAIIVHENDPVDSEILAKNQLHEVRTREEIITNAVIGYNARIVSYNSNRCCSP